jgi:hypothetical protein
MVVINCMNETSYIYKDRYLSMNAGIAPLAITTTYLYIYIYLIGAVDGFSPYYQDVIIDK